MKKFNSKICDYLDAAFARPYSPGQYLANVSAVVVAYGVLLTSYLGLIYTESFSALMMDSWCDPKTEGMGNHCFSDFYSVREISNSKNPWESGSTYPPLPILVVKAISKLGGGHSRLQLLIYLTTLIFSLLVPFFHMKKHTLLGKSPINIKLLILIFCSGPFLMSLDRGNNVVYLFALTYFVYFHSTKFEFSLASYFIVAASLIKPQMILLLLILVINNKILILIKATLIYLIVNISLFLCFSIEIWSNLMEWVKNLSGYQTYAGVPSLGNYSFANSIGLFKGIFGLLTSDIGVNRIFRPGMDSKSVGLLSGFYLLTIILLMFWRRNSLDIRIQLFILTCMIIIVPGTSFGYYVLLLLVPLLFLETIKQRSADQDVRIDALYDYSNIFNRSS